MDTKNNIIYFDNNRSTATDAKVLETMQAMGGSTDKELVVKTSLNQLSALVGCRDTELYFTPGAAPSISLGISATYENLQHKGNHIITSQTEHQVVLETCLKLEKQGAEISYISVDREGILDLDALTAAIKPNTVMVCLMAANNETGVLSPVEKIAAICRKHQLVFFSDGSQFVGKEHCDIHELGIDCLAFGSHKMYGPKGIGALFVSEHLQNLYPALKLTLEEQQAAYFPVTEHVNLAAGFGKAAAIANADYWQNSTHISRLKNYFEHQLLDIEGLRINGSTRHRLYNTSNLMIPSAQAVLELKNKYAFLSNHNRISKTLQAMGLTEEENHASFRFSFGKNNTLDEVKMLVEDILRVAG